MNYTFGFAKPQNQYKLTIKHVVIFFLCAIGGWGIFKLFPLFQFVIQASDTPQDVTTQDLRQLSVYTDLINPHISQTLRHISDIGESYRAGFNIFALHQQEILFVINTIQSHYAQLIQYLPDTYKYIAGQLYDVSFSYDTIRGYLGADQAQHYLVILQNTSEKRPNGGFFGSFAILTVDGGQITKFKIIDSYYPNHIAPDATVQAPQRAQAFLPTLDMGFVSINKFGFTDLDGRHIADLYQKIFRKSLAGVIFVKTDLFEYIIPDFQQQIRELQFMNATVDLRRKAFLPNKKEYYLKYVNSYLAEHKQDIIMKVIQNLEHIATQHWIQIYMTDRNPQIESRLKKNNLTTLYDPHTMYLRDNNIAYNKLDSFVSKYAELKNSSGNIISQTHNDYLDIADLQPGVYDLWIYYHLNIPTVYKDVIQSLSKKHDIVLTQREQHILGLTNIRDTRGMIYMPPRYQVIKSYGDQYYYKTFTGDFSSNIMYKVSNTHNHSSKIVKLQIQVPY